MNGAPFLLYSNAEYPGYISVRFKQDADISKALAQTEKIFTRYNPAYPFEYAFTDVEFTKFFNEEALTGKLAGIFVSLAIFISCLGLFGLAAYTAERRTKEIGIRKVMGASVAGLTGLLSREFMKLVAVSCLLAFPAAWWLMNNWLNEYAYRITISWWIFIVVAVGTILATLLTVSYKIIKTASINPIKSLRAD